MKQLLTIGSSTWNDEQFLGFARSMIRELIETAEERGMHALVPGLHAAEEASLVFLQNFHTPPSRISKKLD